MKPEVIKIDDVEYVRKDSMPKEAERIDGMPFVLVRTHSAGVHYGYLAKRESTLAGIEVKLLRSRRIYYWDGACSLSQIAMEGVTKPENCKFAMEVNSIELVAIEIIPITEKAQLNLARVSVWKK